MKSALKDRVDNFKADYYEKNKDKYKELGNGQQPDTLFITCSDSRICPNHLTSTGPGELFVIRNAGNVVPRFDTNNVDQEALTIEYAVKVLKVKNIVVCGHSKCGAMGGILNPASLEGLPLLSKGLGEGFEDHRTWVEQNCCELPAHEQTDKLIGHNVLEQIRRLEDYPYIKELVSKNQINLEGWVYDFEKGDVHVIKGGL